ncbi:MAG TPA: hypothetical protein VF230_10335 [Acidimicrobiales bacterium]
MSPRLRKAALTAHVASSVGWLGSVAGFLALAVTGLTSDDVDVIRAMCVAMDVVFRLVIVPLALASFVTGVVQAVGTPWGLFRHYWVAIKLVVTVVAVAVLLQQFGPIGDLARAASADSLTSSTSRTGRTSLVVHAALGIVTLSIPLVLSIYKPRGVTSIDRKHLAASR